MKRLTLLFTSLAAASVALATTYVRVEKDGSKTYSDRPLPGGHAVELDPAQTYSAPTPGSTYSSNSNVPEEQRALRGIDDFVYESCALAPPNDETIPNPESVTVTVTLSPPLRVGDSVNLVVDGRAAGPQETSLTLEPVERGAHSASVNLRDEHGRALCSASVTFYVMQPALARPRKK